jgi:hypothetical protein
MKVRVGVKFELLRAEEARLSRFFIPPRSFAFNKRQRGGAH